MSLLDRCVSKVAAHAIYPHVQEGLLYDTTLSAKLYKIKFSRSRAANADRDIFRQILDTGQRWELPTLSMATNPFRGEVMKLYKNLLYLGREYPQGAAFFRGRLKCAFMKNKDVTDPEKIKTLVKRGEFVIKELEALYFLRKYRAMKKRYYEPEK